MISLFATIRVTRPNGAYASTTPSASGFFCGKVPANETLLFEVVNECGDVVYTENIGPFTADTDLGIKLVLDNRLGRSYRYPARLQPGSGDGLVMSVPRTNALSFGSFPIQINPTDGRLFQRRHHQLRRWRHL